MISLGTISFVIIVQSIIVLLLLVAFLIFLLRLKTKKLNALIANSKSHENVPPVASIEHYFTAEVKLTRARFDSFYQEKDIESEVLAEPDWLMLRINFLDLEKEILESDDREDVFWIDASKKFKKLLSQSHLVKRIKTKDINEDEEDEIKEMKTLLKSQHDDFDDLILKLDGDKSAAEIAELKDKLAIIVRSHTELSSCIFILEDENTFLRDQISSLLKVS